ncbi:MAG: class I SAM-dependent methyltransferase [Pedobacter sp.]|uniref:class I SAM-dependent DNA methyltransferase n=1 Tax=Pedobacter sp. TaxID=1411316 RepID=UPI00339B92E3
MQNNYDPIARYYDVLSRLVYFRAQLKAQTSQLPLIPANSKILIAGGGTGWILEEISKLQPSGLDITYVEISAKMLELSKKRNVRDNMITYVHAAAEDLNPAILPKTPNLNAPYDVIITAFLFDNFSKDKISFVFNKFHNALRSEGLWLFSDFYYTEATGKRWQKYLLKAMYFFFRQISNIETSMLINTEHHFEERFYCPLQVKKYYGGFIKSIVYQKS